MVATKTLKNLVSLTREAVKDARRVVDELVNNLGHRAPLRPSLVKVPVRPSTRPPVFNTPFNNITYRNFTTSSNVKSNIIRKQYPIYQSHSTKQFSRSVPKNFANQFWPYSAFRRPLAGSRSPFPNGLYRNFYGLNSRNFSTYGPTFTREAIQNLTSSLRCFLSNAGELGADLLNAKSNGNVHNTYLSYDGCASQAQATKTFQLAKLEATNVEKLGCYVEFSLPNLKLKLPSISFIDDEILDTIESEILLIKKAFDKVQINIQTIFGTHGSLPLEKRRDSIRVHFPNLDTIELERLLMELNIKEGIVVHNDGYEMPEEDYDEDDQFHEIHRNESDLVLQNEYDDDLYDDEYDALTESSTPSNMSAYSFKCFFDENNELIPELTSTESETTTNSDSEFVGVYYPVLSDMESDSMNEVNGIVMVHRDESFSPDNIENLSSFEPSSFEAV